MKVKCVTLYERKSLRARVKLSLKMAESDHRQWIMWDESEEIIVMNSQQATLITSNSHRFYF